MIRYLVLTICLSPLIISGQSLRPEVKRLVDSIIKYNQLDGPIIGYSRIESKQYARLNELTETASVNELVELTNNRNSTIKCAAFRSLCYKDSFDVIPILLSHLYDTSLVYTQQGCITSSEMTGDNFLLSFYYFIASRDSIYWVSNYQKIVQVDSVLFYDPAIRLAYKEAQIKAINADTLHYDRVREIAIKERIPVSVLALAKYKKQQDIDLIKSYFADEKTQYYAIWAVREFPDSSFYPLLVQVFEKEWKGKYYDYNKWRILYQALAKYPNTKTLGLFDKTIGAGKKFRRQTLGRYLTIAITKYPNPLFDKYQNKVSITGIHKEFLGEEANIEN